MKTAHEDLAGADVEKEAASRETLSRRDVLAGLGAVSATILLPGSLFAATDGKKTFTILHTNDLHSNFMGMSPESDYTPFTLNDDQTRGGFARLAPLIAARKAARQFQGPVLVLDDGDYTNGTAFGAATRETGAELQLLFRMGYDATTFGNHEFDFGPDGLGTSIDVAAKAGRTPPIIVSNTDFSKDDSTLADLQRLAKDGVIRRHLVIERGGIRFGIFGLLGKEAAIYTSGGAASFPNAVETAKEMVTILRDKEKVDVVIALSHGGLQKGKDGRFTEGEDVDLARTVTGIDVVISGHSHTETPEAIIVNGHTPVVQTGKYGENLGELVMTLDGGRWTVASFRLIPIDDTIPGDHAMTDEIDKLKKTVTKVVFASRGYSIDQPLAVVPQDMPNTFTDIAAGTPLANLVSDAFRKATKADIALNANGAMRAGLSRGKSGVITVYDVFAVAPLGAGVVDSTAGSALVTTYLTGQELKHILEFLLIDNPVHPGETFPRTSGMRFRYDLSRTQFDVVTAIEIGDLDRGYKAIDIMGKDERLYSFTCSLYVGKILVAIPTFTKGKLKLVPKNKEGQPLKSKVEALDDPRHDTPDLLPPPGTVDKSSVNTVMKNGGVREIKEWQAVMDYISALPVKTKGELPMIPVDEHASEVRAIKAA
jgi:5'-nucleotidase / UDP-sugar diphosphatase